MPRAARRIARLARAAPTHPYHLGMTTVDALTARARDDPSVLAVLLFGSHARGEAIRGSDVDVCLVVDASVEDPTDLRLAYLSRYDADVHVFQQLPLYVRVRILKDHVPLLVKDEDAFYELAIRTVREFEDFRPYYDRYLEAVADGRP